MSVATLLERIQHTWLSEIIGQTIWGVPIVGALHVLAIALFAGPVLLSSAGPDGVDAARLGKELRFWKAAGLALVLLTGVLLFVALPVYSVRSMLFKVKMALLVLIFLNSCRSRRSAWVTLALWAAVIVAARGMAFY